MSLTAVIQEAYIQGISTRSVDELVRAMGLGGVSKLLNLGATVSPCGRAAGGDEGVCQRRLKKKAVPA